MKLNASDFLRKSQFPLLIALGTLPVFMLILLHNTPASLPALWPLLSACVLLCWLCMLLPGKVRIPAGILGCAVLMALGFALLPIAEGVSPVDRNTVQISQSAFACLVPLLLCVLLLYSLQFASWPREKEIPFNWYATGIAAHLFVQLISYAERRQGSAVWIKATPYLTAAFIPFLMLSLLSMNRITMYSAALGRQHIPPSMRRRNVAITLCLLGVSLIVAGIPAIVRFFEYTALLVLGAIGRVLAFIAGLLETEDVPGMGSAGGGADMMPYVEYREPSLLAVILEKIAMALAFAAAVLLAFFILRQTCRALFLLLQRLRRHLMRYTAVASQDYVDEITDTRDESGETSGSLFARIRRLARENERRMTPTQRIRYRYRLLLRLHPDWHLSRTARENLPPETAALYEQARYSGQEVSEEAAEAFKKAISRNG